MYIALLIAHFC